MKMLTNDSGQAIIVVLMISLILGILLGGVTTFFRGQVQLLSKSAKDYVALCAAEAGINCVFAELKANPSFVTHGNTFIPEKDWSNPTTHTKDYLVGEIEGIELDYPKKGAYSGRIFLRKTKNLGEFKTRMRLLPAKNSLVTKTIEESHRFYLLESIGKVEDTCRKVTVILEKNYPGAYLLYDGQVLDVGGYGPYPVFPGTFRRGRIYAQDLIQITRRGYLDAGQEFLEVEKISTPGHLKVKSPSFIVFRNGQEGWLKPETDSTDPTSFAAFPEKVGNRVIGYFVQDGNHGGKSERFPQLNPKLYREAKRPPPKMLFPGCGFEGFSESKWRNPAKPEEVVYDLNFGWEYKNIDSKELIYSTVPIRVWGCPPFKALTIFCEKDVYIAGDFNANPDTPQIYDYAWRDYTDPPQNGTDKNGVMILSLGRIWFDFTQPILFLRNEMETLIDYEIAMRLGGKNLQPAVLAPIVYPPRFSTGSDPRLPMTTLNFKNIADLFALPKEPPEVVPITLAAIPMHNALEELRQFFEPSSDPAIYRQRFCIKHFLKRQWAIEKLGAAAYMTGIITKDLRRNVIRSLLDQVQKEILEDEPDPCLGPWNVADRLFKLAVSHPRMGFRMPEMTVNALLIDSAELNAKWDPGNGKEKVLNEIGNIKSAEARCFPYVFASDTRMILRHMGTEMHLRTHPIQPFLDGKLRNDSFIIRRKVWDSTFVPTGGDYVPPYKPAAFTIASWEDSSATLEEWNSFK